MKALIATAVLSLLAPLAHAEAVPNAKAVAEVQQLLFGDTTTKTESLELQGKAADSQPCSVSVTKTRYGVYVGVKVGDKGAVVGLTNSHYTTSDLEYSNDRYLGELSASRTGISNINERGEDYSHEELNLSYQEQDNGRGTLQVVELTYQPLKVDDDKNQKLVYSNDGEATNLICTVE